MDISLIMTCGACPEQYDAYSGGKQVAYLRLRHGVFTVDAPNYAGEAIFAGYPIGDGCFTDEERDEWLEKAKAAIRDHYSKNGE